jgi:acylphosphatase
MGGVRRRVVIHGRVQGVGFRIWIRDRARTRGVAGTVGNRADGAVEAVFEGPEEAVAAMLALARRGPPDAWVDRLEVADEQPRGESGFEVVRDRWPGRGLPG